MASANFNAHSIYGHSNNQLYNSKMDQTAKSPEHRTFLEMRRTIASTSKDIAFLKKCRKEKLTPVSHRIKVGVYISTKKVKEIEGELIRNSIRRHHAKLDKTTLECYALHLKLAKKYPQAFPLFLTKVKVAEKCEAERKRKILSKKLQRLREEFSNQAPTTVDTKPKVQTIEGYVVNRSTQQFTEEQMTHLNKGLGYAVTTKPDLEQIIVDVETAISHNISSLEQNSARTITAKAIRKGQQYASWNKDERRVLKELKEKPVFYIKADKGNSVVIMDKNDYDAQMTKKINEGPYRQQRVDPLPELIKQVDKTIKECKIVIGDAANRLKEANPILPRIKGQPKIHKPGNEMREIIAADGSPTHKLARWLVREFQSMPKPFPSRSVINTQEFAVKLQESGEINEDEMMVSFDVAALFPSVPVKEALSKLEDWLLLQHDDQTWRSKVKNYLKLARLCMGENYFTFRGSFYKQTKGAPMGNPLSPFLCELFMADLEKRLDEQGVLPRRWWRYVDDVFSIVKREHLPQILDAVNRAHKDIRFTHEEEKDGQLSFLDLLITRGLGPADTPLSFEVYRKPTNTQRVIPYTSNHSFQHKMAAFHHMAHRMLTLPLSGAGKIKEREYILDTANINGYQKRTVEAIISRKERILMRNSFSTLTPTTEPLKRVSVPYSSITKELRPRLNKFGIDLVFSSRQNQLKTLLGSTKDPVDTLGKAGVYKISCSHCNKVYVGQTKRTLEVRFKEHLAEVNKAKKQREKGLFHNFSSKVAEHIYKEDHSISTTDVNILRRISTPWKLDVAESLEIFKQIPSTLLNRDQGNGFSWLFRLLPNNKNQRRSIPIQEAN